MYMLRQVLSVVVQTLPRGQENYSDKHMKVTFLFPNCTTCVDTWAIP